MSDRWNIESISDEETGEAWESMTLAEAVARIEEEDE